MLSPPNGSAGASNIALPANLPIIDSGGIDRRGEINVNVHSLLNHRIIGAVSVNFIPLAGVFLFGWSAFTLMVLYWLENLIIGLVTIAKMLLGSLLRSRTEAVAAVPVSAFFFFHYGIFCFVHGIFVWSLFGPQEIVTGGHTGFFGFPISIAFLGSLPGLKWAFLLLLAAHGGLFLLWLAAGEWRSTNVISEFKKPYIRIVLLHITILAAGMPVMLLGSPIWGVVILALLKSGLEIYFAIGNNFPMMEPDDAKKTLDALREHGTR